MMVVITVMSHTIMFFMLYCNCNAHQHIYKLHQLTDNVIYIANLIGIDK